MKAIFHPEHGWLTRHPHVCLLILAVLIILNGAI
jgi:hypothetical protein